MVDAIQSANYLLDGDMPSSTIMENYTFNLIVSLGKIDDGIGRVPPQADNVHHLAVTLGRRSHSYSMESLTGSFASSFSQMIFWASPSVS